MNKQWHRRKLTFNDGESMLSNAIGHLRECRVRYDLGTESEAVNTLFQLLNEIIAEQEEKTVDVDDVYTPETVQKIVGQSVKVRR